MVDSDAPTGPRRPILVTGASGFIGSRIVRRLLRDGLAVAGLVEELSPQHLQLLERALEDNTRDDLSLWVCDLHEHREVLSLVEKLRPSACIHTAWNVKPGVYRESPDNDRWVEASLRLIEVLLDNGCNWLGVLGTCFETARSHEASTPYARAKTALRRRAQDLIATRHGSRLCWLQIFQPYGPGEHPARLFPALIDACISRSPFTVRTGRSVRDFIHVDDIARAVSLALRCRADGTFSVGTGGGRSVAEVAKWIADLLGSRDLLEVQPPPAGATEDTIVADPGPLEKIAGWRPRVDFAAAIKQQIAEAMVRPPKHPSTRARPCPVCGSADGTPICAAVDQPLILNLLYQSREQAIDSARTKISFLGCGRCGFVFNDRFDPDSVAYASGYINDQSHSEAFMRHSRNVLERLSGLVEARPGRIIEIGCGQGGFLRTLHERTGRAGIGFDPACVDRGKSCPDVVLRPEPFTQKCAEALANDGHPTALICCRHVLEHLPDPRAMLRTIRMLAAPSGAMVYLETPSYDWIARRGAFFDFFNEHCSLFTADSIRRALAAAGLRTDRITEAFGGQYLCVEAAGDADPRVEFAPPQVERPADFASVAARMNRQRRRVSELFEDAAADGPVLVWGAAGKGVSLAAHLGLDDCRVPFFIDINPEKQGRYVPVSGQRVLAPQELPGALEGREGRPTIAVTNPNYADEIAGCLESLNIRADLIVLTEKDQIEPHG